jgi:hypothetical protein
VPADDAHVRHGCPLRYEPPRAPKTLNHRGWARLEHFVWQAGDRPRSTTEPKHNRSAPSTGSGVPHDLPHDPCRYVQLFRIPPVQSSSPKIGRKRRKT